jgi:predicted nicotinamide N-methyase
MVVCDVMYVPELAEATARRVAEQARRGGHVLVGDPGRPARRAFLDELARELGRRVSFVPAHEAPRLAETAGAGGVPELRLLLFDEHCRPPFYGIR